VGAAVEPGKHAFKVIGAHTDSPALKVKKSEK
jgi:aspartyl aminopeptidase